MSAEDMFKKWTQQSIFTFKAIGITVIGTTKRKEVSINCSFKCSWVGGISRIRCKIHKANVNKPILCECGVSETYTFILMVYQQKCIRIEIWNVCLFAALPLPPPTLLLLTILFKWFNAIPSCYILHAK